MESQFKYEKKTKKKKHFNIYFSFFKNRFLMQYLLFSLIDLRQSMILIAIILFFVIIQTIIRFY